MWFLSPQPTRLCLIWSLLNVSTSSYTAFLQLSTPCHPSLLSIPRARELFTALGTFHQLFPLNGIIFSPTVLMSSSLSSSTVSLSPFLRDHSVYSTQTNSLSLFFLPLTYLCSFDTVKGLWLSFHFICLLCYTHLLNWMLSTSKHSSTSDSAGM